METILITGGHGGIGLACSKELASRPELDIVLAGRSMDRMEAIARPLQASRGGKVRTLLLDISSLTSVRSAAAQMRTMLDRGEVALLKAVLCNAGGQFRGPISYTPDGHEETFATNHLGNVLLVNLLLDRVAEDGRIVFTASGTHDPDTADGKFVGKAAEPNAIALANDGKDRAKPLSGGVRYTTSKLCTILFAYELDRRLRQAGSSIASIAFDPGSIPETGLLRTMPKPVQWLAKTAAMKGLMKRMGITQGSVGFSGTSLARIAASPDFANASGRYLQSNDGRLIEQRSSTVSYDQVKAAQLWADSETLVHLRSDEKPALLAKAHPQLKVSVA